MFVGFADLNTNMADWLQTTDAAGLPIAPDAPPTYKVYDAAGQELSAAAGSCSQIGSVTGFFLATVPLNDSSGFEAGERYSVRFSWAAAAAARAATHTIGVT